MFLESRNKEHTSDGEKPLPCCSTPRIRLVAKSLLLYAILDSCAFAYFVLKGQAYAGFGILAGIAGVYLYFGSPRAFSLTVGFASFYRWLIFSVIAVFLLAFPKGIALAILRQYPWESLVQLSIFAVIFIYTRWVTLTLRSERPALLASQSLFKRRAPQVLAVLIVFALAACVYKLNTGEDGKEAVELAKREVGDIKNDREYFVTSGNWSANGFIANVLVCDPSRCEVRSVARER